MTATPPPPASATGRLQRLEHEVEAAVEHAVEATDRSLARRFGARFVRGLHRTVKALGLLLSIGYFVSGLTLLVARYWLLPRIDEARPWIEARASHVLGAQVRIGRIDAHWHGLNPVLSLNDVRLLHAGDDQALALPRVDATIAWATAPLLWVRFHSLALVAPELEVRRLADGRFQVAGYTIDPDRGGDGGALDWLLSQSQIEIRDARLRYIDEARPAADREVLFDDLDFELRNGLASHRFALRVRPPTTWAGPLDVRGNFAQPLFAAPSSLGQWRGELYVAADFVDLARVTAFLRLQAAGERIASAQGALRLWAQIDHAQLTRLTADLALVDVSAQLGADTAPLRVRSLQGRLTQRVWGNASEGGQEIALGQLTLGGEHGATAPIGRLRLRTTRATAERPARGELSVQSVELDALARLAPTLPLPAAWREPLVRYDIAGHVSPLAASWEEATDGRPPRYTVAGQFKRLQFAAPPDAPGAPGFGFSNLDGQVELTEAGGTLRLASSDAVLVVPQMFDDPRFVFDRLDTVAHWTSAARLELRIESLALRNADLEAAGSGTWRRAPAGQVGAGEIDASGTVARLAAAAAYRYVPRAAGANVRAWLRDGLRAGTVESAPFRLRGELDGFPWGDGKRGEFRATGELRDLEIDYVAGAARDDRGRARAGQVWPVLQGVRGSFVFAGNGLEVKASQGRTYGLRLAQAVARIPDMAHNAHLSIAGSGGGPLADMLRLVDNSPIAQWTRGATAAATGEGNARFNLALDLPLAAGGATRVRGAVALAGNDLALGGNVPPLTGLDGTLEFSEQGLAVDGLTGSFLGGRVRLTATTQPGGVVVVEGSGTASVAALGESFDEPIVRAIARRASGSANYRGRVVLGGPLPVLEVESDLVGVALALPPPLAKPASEPLPLRLEHRTPATGPDEWRATAEPNLLNLRLQRRRDARGELRLARGAVGINAPAALPEQGLRVAVDLARVDAAQWSDLLDELLPADEVPPVPGRAAVAVPMSASFKVGELLFEGVRLHRLDLTAARGVDGEWTGRLAADEAAGNFAWRPPRGAAQGLLRAQLARLALPRSERDDSALPAAAASRELPALDLTVEDFQLGQSRYGRLELQAADNAQGWRLNKLVLTNPEATFSATGGWTAVPGGGPRQMSLKFALDIADGGGLLARLGMPGVLRHTTGKMSGDIAWRGVPTKMDYGTLDGTLTLDLRQGQFLKVDPGAARLLSIVSLQGLAQRATLDFSSFESGFAFNTIVANAQLAAGVLSTRDFKMVGPSAAVLIDGQTNLARETQSLRVLVLPDVTLDSASLLYAALVNPAIGLGTFVAQMVLRDPLSKLFAIEYSVTGTWSDPILQRIERRPAAPAAEAGKP